MPDQGPKQSVVDARKLEPGIDAAAISATAHNGGITLVGHVESYAHAAVEDAELLANYQDAMRSPKGTVSDTPPSSQK